MLFFVLQNKSRGKISKIEIEEKKKKIERRKKNTTTVSSYLITFQVAS